MWYGKGLGRKKVLGKKFRERVLQFFIPLHTEVLFIELL